MASNVSGSLSPSSIDGAKLKQGTVAKESLDNSVQASLNAADSAIQAGDLAAVATTGSYTDLSNQPNILELGDGAQNAFYGDKGKSLYDTFGGKSIAQSIDTSSDVPTSNAVKTYVDTQISTYITNVINRGY